MGENQPRTFNSSRRRKQIFKWGSSSHRSKVNSTKSTTAVCFFERLHWVSVSSYKFLSQSRCRRSVAKIFSFLIFSTATKPPLAIHSRVKSVKQKSARLILIGRWSDSWDNWNKGRNAKDAAFVAGVSLLLFVTLPPTLTPATQAMLPLLSLHRKTRPLYHCFVNSGFNLWRKEEGKHFRKLYVPTS